MTNSFPEKQDDFFQAVYAVVRLIPKGRATSYGAIAKCLGSGKSSRMVGWAMSASHSLTDVPAHRVVNRNGMLTGKFHFKTETQMQQLLESEGVLVQNDKISNWKEIFWDPMKELEIKGIL